MTWHSFHLKKQKQRYAHQFRNADKQAVRNFQEHFDAIHSIKALLVGKFDMFQRNKIAKVLNRVPSVVLLLTPEIKYIHLSFHFLTIVNVGMLL